MSLQWVRLDANIHTHDKISGLVKEKDGYRAACVYMWSLGWAGGHGTDGHIPHHVLDDLRGKQHHADLLVKWKLWLPASGGWTIRNFDERQELSFVTEAKKAQKRLAAIKANCVRHHGQDCGCWRLEDTDRD